MIVSWPGQVKPQTRCNDYVIIEDFFPSILEMAGIKNDKIVQPIDGRSFIPLLTGKGENPSDGRALFWNCPNLWDGSGPGVGPSCTIREGDWKLIYFYETGKKELFNISEDIGENHEQSASYPERVADLSAKLGTYLRSVDAQRPSFKATDKPCPWPDEKK